MATRSLSFDFAVGVKTRPNMGRPIAERQETGRHTERDHILGCRTGHLERVLLPLGGRGQ